MHLRAVGEKPAAADSLGVNVYGLRYLYVFIGGCLAGLAGALISLSSLRVGTVPKPHPVKAGSLLPW